MEENKPQTLLWTETGFPYRVTIPAETLNEVRISVVEAFYSVPRGGVEIGGVFFGFREGDTLRVEVTRPIKCEYASGPSFTLSTKDQIVMAGVVGLPDCDPELRGMSPLGWFHSHTRSEIFLSPADLQLYNEFFPEKWQFAMVLRPGNLQATRAGFFVREARGRVQAEAPARECILEPPTYGLTLLESAGPAASIAPATEAAMAAAAATEKPVEVTKAAPQPETAVSKLPESVTEAPLEPVEVALPTFGQAAAMEPRSKNWIWAVAMILMLCLVAGAALVYWPKPGRPAEIGLETYDVNGAFLVRWDRESSVIKQAKSATLVIQDGQQKRPVELSPQALSRGGYGFVRLSSNVSVHMKVEGPQAMEEDSTFEGTSPQQTAENPAADPKKPATGGEPTEAEKQALGRLARALAENRQMKTELINESMGRQDLQQTIDSLNRQLAEERARGAAPKQ